jgi:hypothetical protein
MLEEAKKPGHGTTEPDNLVSPVVVDDPISADQAKNHCQRAQDGQPDFFPPQFLGIWLESVFVTDSSVAIVGGSLEANVFLPG